MRTIWKFDRRVDDLITLRGPAPLNVVHVAPNGPTGLSVWAEVDTGGEDYQRTLVVVGTGNPRPDNAHQHVGSVVAPPFVWHIYDTERPSA